MSGAALIWSVGTEFKELRSPALDEDQSFAFTFAAPGTYAYYRAFHPHMTGTVIVR
jgi:plastocyanin